MTFKSPKLNEMLQQLIALPSMNSASPESDTSNREVVDLLASWLDKPGFEVTITPLPDQTHQPDEYLSLDRIQPTVEWLSKLIRQFCL
ncbi:MAG: hypothetical protein L3J89_01105 [Gammaproteobacteria bacterium]|nr:hypothetical protein [Gammaproteobacteria bacterium]